MGGGEKLRRSQVHRANRTPVFRVRPVIDHHPSVGSDSAKHLSDKDMHQLQPPAKPQTPRQPLTVDKAIILWVIDKTVSNSLLASPECSIY